MTRSSRSSIVQALLYRLLRLTVGDKEARRLLKTHPTAQPGWLRTVQGWNTKPVTLEFDPELRKELNMLFAPHMRNLETLLVMQPNGAEDKGSS
jgi:hypothetical protein